MTGDELKARFAEVRLHTAQHQQLDELVRLGKWPDAVRLAESLGIQIRRGVVRIDAARARG
jgi:hypothetical protein